MAAGPFPGLLPYDGSTAGHFRGRSRQVDDLLSILQGSRFVGLVGPEGSGKTSLLMAGLVPALQRGFKGAAGTGWRVCHCQPGITPVENLAFALAGVGAGDEGLSLERQLDFTAMFRADHSGLIRAVASLDLPAGQNLLICIDGFEELFELSGKYLPDMNSGQEAELLVSNIARLLGAPGLPVYVLVTLRSGHIPSLYNFRSLHPYLGTGLYTVPMFRSDDFRDIVCHGLHASGLEPAEEVVASLREQFGQDLRHLPALQAWLRRAAERYRPPPDAEGRVPLAASALSVLGPLDAGVPDLLEAFHGGLSDRERHVMCQLFSHVALPGEGQFTGKPETALEVCERRDIPKPELDALVRRMSRELPGVLAIAEPYAKQVAHFREQPIPGSAVLRIANAFLLRGWRRMSEWLEAERGAAALYLRLSEAARMYAVGQTALLRPPDLDLFHQWWGGFHPQPAWAGQFNTHYRQAERYLNDSVAHHHSEMERLERERREELRKARRRVALGLSVGVVSLMLAIAAAFFAVVARQEERKASDASDLAERKKKLADRFLGLANRSAVEARDSAAYARTQRDSAIIEKRRADSLGGVAGRSAQAARDSAASALEQRDIARRRQDEAQRSDSNARESARKARLAQADASRRADYQSAAKRVLDLLLKARTSNFDKRDSSVRFVRDVADAYVAFDTSSRNLNSGFSLPDNNLFELLWSADTQVRDSLGGKSVSRRELYRTPDRERGLRDIAVFRNERIAAVGDLASPVVCDLPAGTCREIRLPDIANRYRAVEFIDRDRLLLLDVRGNLSRLDLSKPGSPRWEPLGETSRTAASVHGLAIAGDVALTVRDGALLAWDLKRNDGANRRIPVSGRTDAILPLGNGQVLVATSGGLQLYDPASKALSPVNTPAPLPRVTAMAQAGSLLFTGNARGQVMAYELIGGRLTDLRPHWQEPISAHRTQVTALRYDPVEDRLYTAGLDRNAIIFSLGLPGGRDINTHAIRIVGFRKWIWDLATVPGPQGSTVYSADEGGHVLSWVTQPAEMHRRLGEYLRKEAGSRPANPK